jgi:hypothetical protein
MATKAQVENIVANVGSTAELVDVRYGADGKTYGSAGESVRAQVTNLESALASHVNADQLFSRYIGSLVLGRAYNYLQDKVPTIAVLSDNIRARALPCRYWQPVRIAPNPGYRVSVIFFDDHGACKSETGWTLNATVVPAGQLFGLNIMRTDNAGMTEGELPLLLTIQIVAPEHGAVLQSVNVEHGRVDGASYTFLRIPYTANNGGAIRPVLALTSADGSLAGAKRSPLLYARDNNKEVTINAGLFNVTTNRPVGQTIIGGVSIVDTPMMDDNGAAISATECYPLCIDAAGILSAPYDRNVSTADMIADGVAQAITGWGKLVEDFAVCSADIEAETVHPGKYIRQCIGQFQNGDYCVLTVDQARGKVSNEAGLTYERCAQLLVDKGVKFAYSLDGGGSAATVLGKRQLNPVYEGTTGRAVPTVITFDII